MIDQTAELMDLVRVATNVFAVIGVLAVGILGFWVVVRFVRQEKEAARFREHIIDKYIGRD
jgi:positive regulator of sigma E activity